MRMTADSLERAGGYRKWWSIYKARAKYLAEVNDPALRPKPRAPKPPRRDKRRPGKPR